MSGWETPLPPKASIVAALLTRDLHAGVVVGEDLPIAEALQAIALALLAHPNAVYRAVKRTRKEHRQVPRLPPRRQYVAVWPSQ